MGTIDDIMGKKNVGDDGSSRDEGRLTGIDELAHLRFQRIGQDSCDDFVKFICQRCRLEIRRIGGYFYFRNESNEGVVDLFQKHSTLEQKY